MVTSLPDGACLTAVRFPVWQGGKIGTGFHEVNARSSDFAFVSAAAQIELGADDKCKRIAIGIGAATDHPIRLESAERQLTGGILDLKAVRAAVDEALTDIEALDDLHATAVYRRRVAAVLAVRAVADALDDAQGRKAHAH
jgi:carbon-monoxide dehydrogenase medium subunit